MSRDETERLLDLLREHHPEMERHDGWESMDRRPVRKEPEPEKVPEPVAAPPCPDEDVLTPTTTTMRLICEVAAKHEVDVTAIKGGRRRFRKHIAARHEAMSRLRDNGLSLHQIARLLGGYDHSTVHHGLQAHAARVQREADRGA